jgi:NAD(P)-dependent dehydrogenase (short-subunit alcohol dehydrogenase family)
VSGALAGRCAVVTGGGRGIGAAIARALAAAGAAVVVAARTADEIEGIAAELRAGGARAFAARCDVTDEASVEALATAARVALGHVDVLVNNAGSVQSSPLAKLTLEQWNATLGVIATGTFLCTRAFAPAMLERGFGRVVNVASVAGLHGGRYIAHYSAAKHAVIGFTRSIAMEFEGTGVTASAVCPGYADTPMTARTLDRVQARTGLDRDQALSQVLASTGQSRLVAPEEVADAVVALCTDPDGNGDILLLEPLAEDA